MFSYLLSKPNNESLTETNPKVSMKNRDFPQKKKHKNPTKSQQYMKNHGVGYEF